MPSIEYTRTFDGPAKKEYVRFFHDSVDDAQASLAAGRPIFKDVEMLEIRFPGNNLTVVCRKVSAQDKIEYAQEYQAFKADGTELIVGTPLSAWTALSRNQVKEFNAMNVMSVENLAAIDDHGMQRMGMGGRLWRDRAVAFLEAAKDNALTDRLAADKSLLQEQLNTANQRISELGAAVELLQRARETSVNTSAALHIDTISTFASAPASSSIDNTSDYVEPVRSAKKQAKAE